MKTLIDMLQEKLAGIKREVNFSTKPDKDSEAIKMTRTIDFSEATLNQLVNKAIDAIVVNMQAGMRQRPVSEWKSICATPYQFGLKVERRELTPEEAAQRAITKMTPEQLKAFADQLKAMMANG